MHWFGLLFSVIPFAGAALLLREIRLSRRLHRVGVEVLGRIVHQREVSNRSGARFIPTARFTTQFGQIIEAESAGNFINLDFFDGADEILYYDPEQPTCFLFGEELADNRCYWFFALAVLLTLISWLAVWK